MANPKMLKALDRSLYDDYYDMRLALDEAARGGDITRGDWRNQLNALGGAYPQEHAQWIQDYGVDPEEFRASSRRGAPEMDISQMAAFGPTRPPTARRPEPEPMMPISDMAAAQPTLRVGTPQIEPTLEVGMPRIHEDPRLALMVGKPRIR